MSQIRNHYRWYDTAQGLFSGTLSEAEAAAYAELLATNPAAYEFYLQLVELEVALEWHHGTHQKPAIDLFLPTDEQAQSAACAPAPVTCRPDPAPCLQRTAYRRLARLACRFVRPAIWSSVGCGIAFTAYVVLISWGMLDERPQVARHEGRRHEAREPEATRPSREQVATIRDSEEAVWQRKDTHRTKPEIKNQKSEITSGEPLQLASGVVSMQLREGVRLVVEGPAEWSIDGSNQATLRRGKLVARVPHEAIGFLLKTPTATVVDLGTEFGVVVDDLQQTEVAVTTGAVQLSSAAGYPTRLTEGHSVRLDDQGTIVERSDDGTTQFDDLVARVRSGLRPDPNLWVHESFDEPRDGALLHRRHDGYGFYTIEWVAPTDGGLGPYPAFTLRHANIAIGSCFPKGVTYLPTTGIFEHCDSSEGLRRATRYLPKPIDLGRDGEYFISFVGAKYGNNCYGTVGLVGDSPEPTLEAGWTYSGSESADPFVIVAPGDAKAVSPDAGMPAEGAVAFFVLRIVAREEEPDSAHLYVFRPTDTLPADPAALADKSASPAWAEVNLPEFDSDEKLNRLLLNVDGPRDYIQLDEIRIGTTWQAVTGVEKDL